MPERLYIAVGVPSYRVVLLPLQDLKDLKLNSTRLPPFDLIPIIDRSIGLSHIMSYDTMAPRREAVLYACNGDSVQERLKGGRATLTTHRILWSERSRAELRGGVNVCIHLAGERRGYFLPSCC